MPHRCPIPNLAGWPEVTLAELATKIGSGATPRGGAETYLRTRVRFALVRSQNVFDRRFERHGLVFITDEQAEGLRGVVLQRGDVLLNITGDGITFGRACIVPDDVRPACVNQHVSIIRVDLTKADAGYVLSFLTHPEVKSYVESFNAGGSRRAITKGHIESFRLPLPPLLTQRSIANILGTLDDKIELNRRMNETLEAMARSLFNSWFVDFDPVRAKADGRQPGGMDAETAELFPTEFVESELGEIPKGWRSSPLGDLVEVLETGSRPKGGVGALAAGVPSIGAESIVGIAQFDFGKTKYISDEFFAAMGKGHVRSRDVLVYKDGGKPGQLVPHVSMFGDGFPFERMAINEHVYRVRCEANLGQSLLYYSLSSDRLMDEMARKGTGVAVPGLNSTAIRSLTMLVPSGSASRAFNAAVEPWVALQLSNAREARALAGIRNELLPRLLSGELAVARAEPALETCG